MKGKFLTFGDRVPKPIKMDRKNIFITKAGKRINVYDQTQEANVDTEIYTTLTKYGTLERMQLDKQKVAADLSKIRDLRSLYEMKNELDNQWYNLPVEIKQEFKNDKYRFMEEGQEWLNKKIKEEQEKIKIKVQKQEVKENEQK